MNNESEPIFSSTGGLGVSRRQNERLYINARRISDNTDEIESNFSHLNRIRERFSHRIGRVVFRGIVTDPVIKHIANNNLRKNLEVALPLQEFTNETSWLIYLAQNNIERGQPTPMDLMISETDGLKEGTYSPVQRIEKIRSKRYRFINEIEEDQIDDLFKLWGSTFGWSREEIGHLQHRLKTERKMDPQKRTVWFSGIADDKQLISVSMAERLIIPAISGQLDLIESTEWKTQTGYEGQGLQTAGVSYLIANVLTDLQNSLNDLPLIYAECNFQTRADRAGMGAGLRIPLRDQLVHSVPQILRQNVSVNDGLSQQHGNLRDFTFMYLPVGSIRRYYSNPQMSRIMELCK